MIKPTKVLALGDTTIVLYNDNTYSKARRRGDDIYDLEKGIMAALVNRVYGTGWMGEMQSVSVLNPIQDVPMKEVL